LRTRRKLQKTQEEVDGGEDKSGGTVKERHV